MNKRFNSFRRRFRKNIPSKREIPYWLQLLATVASILTSVAALFLSIKANGLSETSLQLIKNDTSQQAQINQLRDVIGGLTRLAELSYSQQQELIKLTNEAQVETVLSNKILGKVADQSSLTNQQLLLSLKNDSISISNAQLQKNANLRVLRKSFDKLYNGKLIFDIMQLEKLAHPSRIAAIKEVRIILENETYNPVVLSEPLLSKVWFTHYERVKDPEITFQANATNGKKLEPLDFLNFSKHYTNQHFDFINTMFKILNSAERKYYSNIDSTLLLMPK